MSHKELWRLTSAEREQHFQAIQSGWPDEWNRDFIRETYANTPAQMIDLIAVEELLLLALAEETPKEERDKRFNFGCCAYLLECLKDRLVQETKSPDDDTHTE